MIPFGMLATPPPSYSFGDVTGDVFAGDGAAVAVVVVDGVDE